jgi:purine-binding chemotaxis protein CheW
MGVEHLHRKRTTADGAEKSVASVRAEELPPGLRDAAVLTPERKQQVLQDRARALAQSSVRLGTQEETLRVVEFFLAHERYAVEATCVREVQHVKQLTPLPCTPSFVLGVINVRGRILSVVDLRSFFDLPPGQTSERDTVIVLHTEDRELGVLSDGVIGAHSLPLKSINPVPPGLSGVRREYLRGIADEQLILLDVKRILSDKRMLVGADEVEF